MSVCSGKLKHRHVKWEFIKNHLTSFDHFVNKLWKTSDYSENKKGVSDFLGLVLLLSLLAMSFSVLVFVVLNLPLGSFAGSSA